MIIGDINIANSIVTLEAQVLILQKIVERLVPQSGLSTSQIEAIKKEATEAIIAKYPNSGVNFG